MILIGLTGRAGVGKDTIADYLVAEYHFAKYAFAQPIKDMLRVLGVDADAREGKEQPHPIYGASPRRMAQTLGTEWGRRLIHRDIWLNAAARFVAQHHSDPEIDGIVLSDVRFENEAAWVRAQGGEVWHVTREVNLVEGHMSEAGVQFVPGDSVVQNRLTKAELYDQIEQICRFCLTKA